MRLFLVVIVACAALSGCGGKYEQLAKCSADDNPVPALGFDAATQVSPPQQALANAVKDDCGPMRPVNQF